MGRCRRNSAGFTLVEMVVTIVILAIAMVAVASMVGMGTSDSADTLMETRATALGNAYLEEIRERRFDERSAASGLAPCYGLAPGPANPCTAIVSLGTDAGETSRERYDDVDDYNGLVEGFGEAVTISRDAIGGVRDGYESFHVAVSVRYAGTDSGLARTLTDAKLITVTIQTRGQAQGWKFSVYKGNY